MVLSFLTLTLPVFAICSGLITLAFYALLRRRTGRLPLVRLAAVWAAVCYWLSIVYLTLLWYWPYITLRPGFHLPPNFVPFIWLQKTYEMGAAKMAEQLVLNIGMFVPCGFLMPVVFKKLRALWKTATVTLLATVSIETLQYFMGRSADVDDVIMNLAGGLAGYLLFALCRRWLRNTRLWRNAAGEPLPPCAEPAEA